MVESLVDGINQIAHTAQQLQVATSKRLVATPSQPPTVLTTATAMD